MQTDPFEITGTTCIIIIVVLVIWLLVSIWVFRDARRRDMNGALWLVVVLVGSLIGLIVYIVVREKEPGKDNQEMSRAREAFWREVVRSSQAYKTEDGMTCRNCGAQLAPETKLCPVCGLIT
jgi:hypothetical protein